MPRIKKNTVTFESRSAFERALDIVAVKQLKLEKIIADYNAEKANQDRAHKAQVKRIKAEINERFVACHSYVEIHRDELLGELQSSETKLADFGFRRSPGVLKTLNSRWTFAKAIEALKQAGKKACLKVSTSLDKSAVKKEIPEAELPKYGLRMDYPEEFWVEAKRVTDPQPKRLS